MVRWGCSMLGLWAAFSITPSSCFVPRSKLGKRLREQHMRHHFQDHRFGYGVSSPIWDVVFGTLPRKRHS